MPDSFDEQGYPELARTMGLPPEPRTVVNTLAEKVNGVTTERRP